MGVPASRHGKKTTRNKIPGAPHGSGIQGVGNGRTFVGSRGSRPAGSDTSELAEAPAWVVGGIPDQSDAEADQPLSLTVAQYIEKTSQVTTFSLSSPPAGFYITTAGKITVAGAAAAAHSVTVTAHNPHGTTDDTFTWTLT